MGFLVAPVAAEAAQTYVARLDRLEWEPLNELLDSLEASGHAFLRDAGVAQGAATVTRNADMQYVGQMHDIAVPVPPGRFGPGDEVRFREAFDRRYQELFQRVVTRIPVDALTWRVTVSAPAPKVDLRWHAQPGSGHSREAERAVYFPEALRFVASPVYDRYALKPGDKFAGPAIVEERESTLVVGPGARVTMDEWGSLLVEMPARPQTEDS